MMGATAGRYHQDLWNWEPGALEVLNVVKIQATAGLLVEKILQSAGGHADYARLPITGMINNTNLATATTEQDLWDGYEMLRQVADLRHSG